ncbi:aspartate/glutamate racemase family protein [Pseudomonas sp. KNUC1026]|uniref:aspartate/glutamate racemase family protein n=1 Tax=Pseudomonas sp. KNUC1026 TaxID=2893890 RepID=UPI001F17D1B3|nr:aspartate/glutamate racemase family protein [Pseudomonas sp. KNUC1026]UFH49327.1 aspartate/glutamate racemase family protein [Pseudomonas sp. KNUC1026]
MSDTDLSGALYKARPRLGIITGSGPEAGMDMWAKLLVENRRRLGSAFRGDIDAPAVRLVSEPELGLSMELERTEEKVWQALRDAIYALDGQVAAFAIACNTLNLFAERILDLRLNSEFVSFQGVLEHWIHRSGTRRLCLLGGRQVAALGNWSPYRNLPQVAVCEAAPNSEALHQLIYDIKAHGAAYPGLNARFEALLSQIEADTVLLACTELPLLASLNTNKTLVDVTQLVAQALLDRSGVIATEN